MTEKMKQWIADYIKPYAKLVEISNMEQGVKAIQNIAQGVYGNDLVQGPLTGMGKVKDETKEEYRKSVCEFISDSILNGLFKKKITSQKDYNSWHLMTCDRIIELTHKNTDIFENLKYGFSYGLAQKWLNMTLKNMLAVGLWNNELEPVLEFLHVPVDNYILKAAKELGVTPKAIKAWSRWDSYDDIYMDFQNCTREKIKSSTDYTCPIEWEFGEWNKQRQAKK